MAAVINYTPEELFNRAQLGTKLKLRERREVMFWLEKSGIIQDWSERNLAKTLGVKIGALKKLRLEAQTLCAASISPAMATHHMAEYVRIMDFVIKDAQDGVKGAPKNTGTHCGYLRLLMEAVSEKIAKLQSVGVIPKELGRLTNISEEWTAVIEDGIASVHPSGPAPETVQ
jgi:hypothetical protein